MHVNDLVSFIQNEFPEWVKDMQKSQHHYDWDNLNPHHLEGDVWSHLMMVMSQARDRHVSAYTEIAALCHDLGKPACREVREDTKRVRFFGHGGVSVFLASEILDKMNEKLKTEFSNYQKQYILELVCWHQDMFSEINEQGQLNSKIAQQFGLQPWAQIEDLLDLMTCDGNGRYSSTNPFEADYKEMLGDQMLGTYTWMTEERRKKEGKQLFVLVGPPLSGKSTWVEHFQPEAFVVSRDDCLMSLAPKNMSYNDAWNVVNQKKVDSALDAQWKEAKQSGRNIVVDMTNMSRKSRRKWLNGLPRDTEKNAIVFGTPLNILRKRNVVRKGKHIHEIVMLNMMKKFSAPTLSEFDNVKWVF